MKQLFLLAIILHFVASCDKNKQQPENPRNPVDSTQTWNDYQSYIIKAGHNYCENTTFDILQGIEKIDFKVVFDSSCIYQNADPNNQYDINKLMGFSDCLTHHHGNSARFGWNWLRDSLQLYAYCYVDSVRNYKSLGAVALNKSHHLRMYVKDNIYYFEVNNQLDSMSRGCVGNTITGYKLLPYFGGDETAPHDIAIRIKYN